MGDGCTASLPTYLPACLSSHLPACLVIHLFLPVCLFAFLPSFLLVCLSVLYLFLCLHAFLYLYLPACLVIFLPTVVHFCLLTFPFFAFPFALSSVFLALLICQSNCLPALYPCFFVYFSTCLHSALSSSTCFLLSSLPLFPNLFNYLPSCLSACLRVCLSACLRNLRELIRKPVCSLLSLCLISLTHKKRKLKV